jgi:hypothetical protein
VSLAGGAASGDVTTTLLDQGVLGAIVVALGVFALRLINRETSRADDAQRRLDTLQQAIRDDILPAVIRATEAQSRAADVLAKVADLLPDVTSALRDRTRR